MAKLKKESSASVCGDTIVTILRQSETNHSYLKNYRKKLASILAKYADLLARSIVNLHSLHVESKPIHSNKLRVGNPHQVKRSLGLVQIQVVQILTFLITWDSTYKLNVYKDVRESELDVLLTWFIDFQ